MKICIAQTKSTSGGVKQNTQNHISFIKRAIRLNADLIVFPELSLTNYAPRVTQTIDINTYVNPLKSFQDLANKHAICCGIGMPTYKNDAPYISLVLFQANTSPLIYSKQILHDDETPYFKNGTEQVYLHINNTKIAFGICYESLQEAHFLNAHKNDVDVYIASVAKTQNGINKAFKHFPEIAKNYSTPILMTNCVGECEDFISAGQSAAWNSRGELISALDAQNEGLIIFDTSNKHTSSEILSIEIGKPDDLDTIFRLYEEAKTYLQKSGIYQWNDSYPKRQFVCEDIETSSLYVLKNNSNIVGAISFNKIQEDAYKSVPWKFNDKKVLVVHRLVIHPTYHGFGYGQKLMNFAEGFAIDNNYTSIRLDCYSQNMRAVKFYENREYTSRGEVYFPGRDLPFYCMEKNLVHS